VLIKFGGLYLSKSSPLDEDFSYELRSQVITCKELYIFIKQLSTSFSKLLFSDRILISKGNIITLACKDF